MTAACLNSFIPKPAVMAVSMKTGGTGRAGNVARAYLGRAIAMSPISSPAF